MLTKQEPMKKPISYVTAVGIAVLAIFAACKNKSQKTTDMTYNYEKGTYGFDVEFFKNLNINTIELKDSGSDACVLVIPAYQGRVMTSSSDGYEGQGYGWINYDLIQSGEVRPQFNPYGGEERLWLGPEGGKFSVYFPSNAEQEFANWKVPEEIDTKPFDIVSQKSNEVIFTKQFSLVNYSGTQMDIGIDRKVKILSKDETQAALGFPIDPQIKFVSYQSENTLTNKGAREWTAGSGVLSIWMLSMFRPSPEGVVFIPFKEGSEKELGKKVNDDYFGKIPEDRLKVLDDMLFFKIDGKFRSKIGISPLRSLPWCGSYDAGSNVLTVLWYSAPDKPKQYVNSKWGQQDDPLKGDVINSYNDGPVEDGSIMGPFYEIESSSPAAFLDAGKSLSHTQRIFHFVGTEEQLNPITEKLFGISIDAIKNAFN